MRVLMVQCPSIPQARLSCQLHTKLSLFPRTLFFDVKLRSNNMSIVWKQFPLSLSYQEAINMFIHPCKGRKRKQTTLYSAMMVAMVVLSIAKNLLKLSFPVCEEPPSMPGCPIIDHNVLFLCCINLIKFTSFARLTKQDGRRYKNKTGACQKHSFPIPITMVHSMTKN